MKNNRNFIKKESIPHTNEELKRGDKLIG